MDAAAVRHVATSADAADVAAALVEPGDVVLVKGSRGVRTELVVDRLVAECGEMLYHLLISFSPQVPVLNVTRYITFRTAVASMTALAISLILGPWLIRRLREFQIGQVIRQEGPQSHRAKAGTPTMGGLLILAAALVPTLLWADLTNVYVWIAVMTTAAFGAIGFLDDYLKITRRSSGGLAPRYKMGLQVAVALDRRPGADVAGLAGPLQHPADLPVLQAADPGSRLVLRAVRGVRARGVEQRRQPHRRPRRAGDQHVRGGRRDA